VSIGLRPNTVSSSNVANGKRWRKADSSNVWERNCRNYKIGLYERALDRDPENYLLILDLARAYADACRDINAKSMLERVLALHPKSALVRAKVAQMYAGLRCPGQALDHYRKVLELDPRFPGESEIRDAIETLSEELRRT
jgi:tetratricopeptide (TPR) repeat protein